MKQKQHDFWNEHFEDVKPTAPQPVPTNTMSRSYADIFEQQIKAIKSADPHLYAQLVKGQAMSSGVNLETDDYITVLNSVIKCIFQCLRDDVNERIDELEDRQEELIKISSAEAVLLSGLEVLKTLKIKLDINLVYTIIHGYIGQCVNKIVKDYEDTRSVKH